MDNLKPTMPPDPEEDAPEKPGSIGSHSPTNLEAGASKRKREKSPEPDQSVAKRPRIEDPQLVQILEKGTCAEMYKIAIRLLPAERKELFRRYPKFRLLATALLEYNQNFMKAPPKDDIVL